MIDPQVDRSRQPISSRLVLLVIGIVAVVVIASVRQSKWNSVPAGISHDQFHAAQKLFRERFLKSPDRDETLFFLAETAQSDGDLDTAFMAYQAVGTEHPRLGLQAKLQAGLTSIQLRNAPVAERLLDEFLERSKSNPASSSADVASARSWLSYLYSIEFRYRDRKLHLLQLHRTGHASLNESKQLYFPSLLIWNSATGRELLDQFLDQTPDDVDLNIAKGRYLIGEGKLDEAQSRLHALLQVGTNKSLCAAILLECLYEKDDWATIESVIRDIDSETDASLWELNLFQGHYAIHLEKWDEAIRYYEKVLSEDVANTSSLMGLATAQTALGRMTEADEARNRVAILARIRPALSDVRESNPPAILKLAEDCDQLGMQEAAEVFRSHAKLAMERETIGR